MIRRIIRVAEILVKADTKNINDIGGKDTVEAQFEKPSQPDTKHTKN
jgi:hypothetical protein